MPDKLEIHISHLTMAEKCGEAYRRRHICGEKRPPGISLHVGKATHKAGELDLRCKVSTGQLIPDEEIKDIARDKFLHDCEAYGIHLDDEEAKTGEDLIIGEATDQAVKLASLYHKNLSPIIEPISINHIERRWVVEASGYPFDLGGMIDVQEAGVIRDTKTSKQTPNQAAIDSAEQYTMYAMAVKVLDGEIPIIKQDSLVKLKTPKIDTKTTTRTQDDFRSLMARLSRFAEVIEKGIFLPARREDWWCSVKFCGYAQTCPFFNGQINYFVGGEK
jgi:hypothetical protein